MSLAVTLSARSEMRDDGGHPATIFAGQRNFSVALEHPKSVQIRLGVKWSQVQILSARHESLQVR
jgi:hypothetical protein